MARNPETLPPPGTHTEARTGKEREKRCFYQFKQVKGIGCETGTSKQLFFFCVLHHEHSDASPVW